MKYQDELEAGKRSRKPNITVQQQVEQYRRKDSPARSVHSVSVPQVDNSPASLRQFCPFYSPLTDSSTRYSH